MRIKEEFNNELKVLEELVTSEGGQWTIKGFIDIYRNIYTISSDTKVISKILEIAIFPHLLKFSQDNGYEVKLTPHQNYYPDLTFIDTTNGDKYAVDLKTSYRKGQNKVNGMTLGAFTGYFRDRTSAKNILYPYDDYKEHFILGVIYTRTDFAKALELLNAKSVSLTNGLCDLLSSYLSDPVEKNWEKLSRKHPKVEKLRPNLDSFGISEFTSHTLENFHEIQSVATNFKFFFVEKWKIAKTTPGSGNTKNIGGVDKVGDLLSGTGPFTKLQNGKSIFNDYWMHYETSDMASKSGRSKPLFKNLKEYNSWRSR